MKKTSQIQYTIRQVPEEVDACLRELAVKEGYSLNSKVLDVLSRAAGATESALRFHDLDRLSGSWVEDDVCERALAAFGEVDESLWK